MAVFSWPASLPPAPAWNSAESGDDNIIRALNSGPAKVRRRYTAAVQKLVWPSMMTDAQVATLRDFYENDVKGVERFDLTHPQTGNVVEARFVKRWESINVGPNAYRVSLEFEILP